MSSLILGKEYSRSDVHQIFSPHTKFTPQAGTWGLHGIVAVPDREADYVFFVTYGQQQADHLFDEGINSEGVLSWQSQPRQTLDDEKIRQFIQHDETTSQIHLFLRTDKRSDYRYYGRLGYLNHDSTREKPVYFQWQLLDWDDLSDKPSIDLLAQKPESNGNTESNPKGLTHQPVPTPKNRKKGVDKETFRSVKVANYAERDERNRQLGEAGELLVVEHEKKRLLSEGRADLAEQVVHVAKVEGDGAGYDVLSFDSSGQKKYIEVKTTRGDASTDFYMSSNEIRFAAFAGEHYYLYRLYSFNKDTRSAEFFIHTGDLAGGKFKLQPISYRVSLSGLMD